MAGKPLTARGLERLTAKSLRIDLVSCPQVLGSSSVHHHIPEPLPSATFRRSQSHAIAAAYCTISVHPDVTIKTDAHLALCSLPVPLWTGPASGAVRLRQHPRYCARLHRSRSAQCKRYPVQHRKGRLDPAAGRIVRRLRVSQRRSRRLSHCRHGLGLPADRHRQVYCQRRRPPARRSNAHDRLRLRHRHRDWRSHSARNRHQRPRRDGPGRRGCYPAPERPLLRRSLRARTRSPQVDARHRSLEPAPRCLLQRQRPHLAIQQLRA